MGTADDGALRSADLALRPFVDADAPAFAAAVRESVDTVGRWMSWCHADYTDDEARQWFATTVAERESGAGFEFGVFDARTSAFVGGAGLNLINRPHRVCNLGYWVRQSAQRRGVASRCVALLTDHAFGALGLQRVEIVVPVGNVASDGVARKSGARFECIARDRLMIGQRASDASVWSLVAASRVGPAASAADAPASWADWVGRSETRSDVVTAAPTVALAATLDNGNPVPAPGDPLPPLWHWLYVLPHPRRSEIGPDGHAARGGFLPPVPLPRRMWAGGRLEWRDAIRVGDTIARASRIEDVTQKSGRSGALVFVVVRHTISTARGVALVEDHDIVYRDLPAADAAPTAAPRARTDEAWSARIEPDAVLLFRYSALTFNGHRIHYDRRYVTEVEGYPGLIVHGPLIATLLLELLRSRLPAARVVRFAFRAVGPLFDIAPFDVCGRPSDDGARVELWARAADGSLAMTATADLGVAHEDAP